MANLKELIIKAAQAPQQLSQDDFMELRRADRDYPASTIAAALLLKYDDARMTEDERTRLRTRVALLAGDRRSVITMIDPSGLDFANFYPEEDTAVTPSTESAIDTFLDTYGHQSPEEDALLERMIFNPVPDYAETLARAEVPVSDAPVGSQDSLIDAFLAANPVGIASEREPLPAATPPAPPTQMSVSDDSLLSESLAKIFIKQKRYERAFEIISNLSLNYPKKSCYFADQLRFLQKLIIIQRHAEARKQ